MTQLFSQRRIHRTSAAVAALATLAPAQKQFARVDENAATSVVSAMDSALMKGDLSAYVGLCRPLHPHAHAARVHWLEDASSRGVESAESRVLDFTTIDERGVAFVRSMIGFRVPAGSTAGADERVLSVHSYVVVGLESGEPVVLLDTPVSTEHLGEHPLSERTSSTFGCSACNYAIDTGGDDWVVVPHERTYSGCLEVMTFYSTRTATSVDVSIHVPGFGAEPREMLTNMLGAKLQGRALDAARARVRDWLPPVYRQEHPEGMRGAAVDAGQDLGLGHTVYATVFGPVAYLFTARSPDDAAARQPIERLLTGFMLREINPAKVRLNVRPLVMHTGGRLVASSYRNDKFGFSFDGPAEMDAKVVCGPDLFRVHYTSAASKRLLVLKGMPPPTGLRRWSEMQVDNMIATALQAGSYAILDDSGWTADDTDHRTRQLRARASTRTELALRAMLDADAKVLILVHAEAPGAPLETLLPSLGALVWD